MFVVTVPHLDGDPVTQAELSHLETRRPDDGHSGYKNVIMKPFFRMCDGRGVSAGPRERWRVAFYLAGEMWYIEGTYPSPREAAKRLVTFYRDYFGPDWIRYIPDGRSGCTPHPRFSPS